MAETYGPFDGLDTRWAQAQWFDFAPTWAPSGVIGTPAASYNVGDLSLGVNGLNLTLGTGRAWVHGAGYKNDTGKAFAVTANTNASLSRRDRIVLRRDLAAKTVTAIQLTGTPASTPVAPALTQSETGTWDQPLFSFLVPPNSGTTLTGLTDERRWVTPDGGATAPAPVALTVNAGWIPTAGSVPVAFLDSSRMAQLAGKFTNQNAFTPGTNQIPITIPSGLGLRPATTAVFVIPYVLIAGPTGNVVVSVLSDGSLRLDNNNNQSIAAGTSFFLDAIRFHPTYAGAGV